MRDAHAGDIQTAFERAIRTSVQTYEFWKDFVDLPEIDIDTAAIASEWNAARDAALENLRAKASAPLEPTGLSPAKRRAIRTYRGRIAEVSTLFEQMTAANGRLDTVREQAAADDVAYLADELARLEACRARFDPTVASRCNDYIAEKNAKTATENLRNQARDKLGQYREQIFLAYESEINKYLERFAASFQLGRVHPVN